MVNFINSWAKGIIIAVIISTIVEMIIPNGNIKKYVKTVIGVYIMFAIISPIISKITGKEVKLSSYVNMIVGEYNLQNTNVSIETDKYIKQNYIENLEKEIKTTMEERLYKVNEIKIEIEEQGEYGKIKSLALTIEKSNRNIEAIEISIGNRAEMKKNELTEAEIKEIKELLESSYGISQETIRIN